MKWLYGIIAAVAGMYGLYLYLFPTYTHRYRLTVEVEMDGKVVSGSGVIEVANQYLPPFLLSPFDHSTSIKGRAPLIDLGRHGVLLAVLRPHSFHDNLNPRPVSARYLAVAAFYGAKALPHGDGWMTPTGPAWREISKAKGTRELSPEAYPGFVWLSDPTSRGSAVPVLDRDMATTIHPSARIRSVVLEITSDRFSDEIFQKLPWLSAALVDAQQRGIGEHPQIFDINAGNLLGHN